jgi:GMP synthase-like glutamine amidotransferase
MKPIAIFRHAVTEGPGYLADFLDDHEIPWTLVRIDAGDTLPATAEDFSGLVFMGGPMSVNDDLPWISLVLALIREAVDKDIPVLGHCLGGQLMSKALGGVVTRNPIKEIGWGDLQVAANDEARRWFGTQECFPGFHWHGETFSIPPGATAILSSAYCPHQAFSYGKHLGFQCHVEMTAEMVRTWVEVGQDEILSAAASPGVQPAEVIVRDLDVRIPSLNRVAAGIYAVWIKGINS